MIKNIPLLFLLAAFFSVAHAGDMGQTQRMPGLSPFLSGEGGYNWRTINGATIEGLAPRISNEPWGGRVAAGFMFHYFDNLRFSNEIGWGYYGATDTTTDIGGFSSRSNIDGIDLLVGALYRWKKTDLFVKVGALVENNRKTKAAREGTFLVNTEGLSFNQTQVLPEIKVGGIYNVAERVGLSVSYMHAFGSDVGLTARRVIVSRERPVALAVDMNGNFQNPSVDAVLFGVFYYI